ncbi:MAG: hypothetical protein ACOCV8_02380 [Spirochaetota bacterium]
MKKLLVFLLVLIASLTLTSCGIFSDEADVAAHNVSKDADNFKVFRQITFYNGITDTYIWTFEGYCSIKSDNYDDQLEVTCKIGKNLYFKHFLGKTDNIGYMVLQLAPHTTDPYHFKIYVRPEAVLPDFELVTSNSEE